MQFDETKHPRDGDGKFTGKEYSSLPSANRIIEKIPQRAQQKISPAEKTVQVDLNTEFQKMLNNAATPKERQKIAFRYIMENLRGKYTADDGRTVAIERVGASKMTFVDRVDKLRVCPALANMIKVGKYDHSAKGEDKPNKKFEEFAYYRVRIKIGNDIYNAMLNVGIRKDGSSTLYDLCPFDKQNK